jgi:hypothetical protein
VAIQGIQQFDSIAAFLASTNFINAGGVGLVNGVFWARTPDGALFPLSFNGVQLGSMWWVDSVNGEDSGNSGEAPSAAYQTITALLASGQVASNDKILCVGDLREESVLPPLGVYNVQIIGATPTRPHHDQATRWREAASHVALEPLLYLREQGWSIANILFAPPSDAPAIRLKRFENATYPDPSHCSIVGNRFVGGLSAIEDDGGCHNQMITDNIFQSQTDSAYECISTSIAVPLQNFFLRNHFISCVHGIRASQSKSIIKDNRFIDITTSKVLTNFNAAQGNLNMVELNFFPSTQANISIAGGYGGSATDIWRNYSTDTAAQTVGVPA